MKSLDPVSNPAHYQLLPGVEVIDVRERLLQQFANTERTFTLEQVDAWSRAWEYLTRCPSKNGLENARKALNYLHRMVYGTWFQEPATHTETPTTRSTQNV